MFSRCSNFAIYTKLAAILHRRGFANERPQFRPLGLLLKTHTATLWVLGEIWGCSPLLHKPVLTADKFATPGHQIAKIRGFPSWHRIDFWLYLYG
jgi:hypothetical protein